MLGCNLVAEPVILALQGQAERRVIRSLNMPGVVLSVVVSERERESETERDRQRYKKKGD